MGSRVAAAQFLLNSRLLAYFFYKDIIICMIREKRYLIFLLIVLPLSLFLYLTVEAAQLNFNDFFNCNQKSTVRDCEFSFIDYDASVDYQLFRAENYTTYFGYENDSSIRVDVCLSQTDQMWTGECKIMLFGLGEGEIASDNNLDLGTNNLNDYNYANIHKRVKDANSSTQLVIKYRRVSIDSFGATPSPVNVGDTITVNWATEWAVVVPGEVPVRLFWDGAVGLGSEEVPASGTKTLPALSSGTAYFTLRACGPGTNGPTCVEESRVAQVNPTPTPIPPGPGNFNLSVNSCVGGTNRFDLSWSNSQYATSYDIYARAWSNGTWVYRGSTGGTSFTTYEGWDSDWYFKIIARNSVGSMESNIAGGENCRLPTVDLDANGSDGPITISYNTSANLSWTSAYATSCTASNGWTGGKALNGSESTGNLTSSKTYTLTCSNAGGSRSDDVIVNVSAPPAPTVDLKCDSADSCGTVSYGASKTLSWIVSGVVDSCTASNAWSGSKSTSGGSESTGAINSNKIWTIQCAGPGGTGPADSVSVTVTAPSVTISANPNPVIYNTSSTITWSATNAGSCTASGDWSGSKNPTGGSESTGNLTSSKTYTLTCSGNGSASNSVTVNVGAAPVMNYFRCNGVNTPGTCNINYGGTATITWSSSNTTGCSLVSTVPTDDFVAPSGSRNDTNIISNRNYNIECWNSVSGVHAPALSLPLRVVVNAPTVDIKANNSNGPITLAWNSSANLSWTSTNSGSCNASGDWSGSKALNGSESTGNLTNPKTYNYVLTCSGNGSVSDIVQVIINNPVPNDPTNVTVTAPDYCMSGPAATIGWTYSDPSGSPQSAYEVQMDEQGSFQDPEYQTGKVLSSSNSNFTGQGVLLFNKNYKTRVRVWNSYDVVSGWTVAPGNFDTPPYAYPQVDFSWMANGILNNPSPPLNKPVDFTDQTVFNGNPNGRQWGWTFGDGGTSTIQNPSHTYTVEGSYYVTLAATDNANQSCSRTKGPLIIQKPIPKWREVAPR